jgi:cytochrome c oxidase assembly protein subunit 15
MTTASCAEPGPARRLLSRVNAAAGLLLLVAGGLVTSTASGLAVPDWPLSFGQYFPRMEGGVFFEHGHRVFAGGVGLLIAAMAALTQAQETRPAVKKLAWATCAAVGLQALLGGITVWLGLPVQTSAAHATLGQTIFVLLVVMAELVGEPRAPRLEKPAGALRWAAALAAAGLWTQLLLGAVLRHGGLSLGWHLAGAAFAVLPALWLSCGVTASREEPALRAPALALGALLLVQLALGGASAYLLSLGPMLRRSPLAIAVTTSHLAVGAFLLGVCALLCVRLFRGTPR